MSGNYLIHYGVGHDDNPPGIGSGRFPFGSGENPGQHLELKTISERKRILRKKQVEKNGKYDDGQIALILGFKNSREMRDAERIESEQNQYKKWKSVRDLHEKGLSNADIVRELNLPEGTVRSILKNNRSYRLEESNRVKDQLRQLVGKSNYIDVGKGSEIAFGISEDRKKSIVRELEAEGYALLKLYQTQITTGRKTTIQVLCPPGTTREELFKHKFDIMPVDRSWIKADGERSPLGLPPVQSVSSDRILIKYAEDGGKDKDGVIELRRGVEELSLKDAHYAQVRIGVDDKLYLKGMAVYADDKDLPPGKDIIFNTNKHNDQPLDEVLKKMKTKKLSDGTEVIDQDNPFGASIKRKEELKMTQREYIDPKTGETKISPINVVGEEGDWGGWSKNLSSQFLSKQPLPLIKSQLRLAYLQKNDEFSDIKSINNEAVRKVFLEDFAEKCETAAVDLKAAALPKQQTHVILPLKTIKPDQIYAPRYLNGTEVILIRHPHAGPFEIPRLIVNNNNREGRSIMGDSPLDAVGISGKAAAQLSGADFDGDTAIVIPVRDSSGKMLVDVKTEKAIKELQEFDPKESYPAYEGMQKVKEQKVWNKQRQMGEVTNLITDMTLQGAPTEDVIKAVKHSMVIIDAEKHNLDWRRSEAENDIKALKKKYQGKDSGGASTIISLASSEAHIEEEDLFRFDVDPETGKKITFKTGEMQEDRVKVKIPVKDANGKVAKDPDTGKPMYEVLKDPNTGRPVYENRVKMDENERKERRTEIQKLYSNKDIDWNEYVVRMKKIGYKPKTQKSTKMRQTDDAYKLTSGYKHAPDEIKALPKDEMHDYVRKASFSQKEIPYAEYANRMKEMANQARLEARGIKLQPKDTNAAKAYETQVKELEDIAYKLNQNAPRERIAQLRASMNYAIKKNEIEDLDKEHAQKLKNQCIAEARFACSTQKQKIQITPKQWEAIENHAISGSKAEMIIKKVDSKDVLQYALPKEGRTIPESKKSLIRAMMRNPGVTAAEVAEQLGVSVSTVQKYSTGS